MTATTQTRPAVALAVAAGRGTRAGPGGPKQYRDLAGAPVLRRTLEALAAHPAVGALCVVIHRDDRAEYERAVAGLALPLAPPVIGGAERQDSVRLGLAALAETHGPETPVLIHDAARPFVPIALVDAALAALEAGWDGACPSEPVVDTLRRGVAGDAGSDAGGDGGPAAPHVTAGDIVPRDGLWRAQTPQVFRLGPILAAHEAAAGQALTDDVAVAAAAGLRCALTPGAAENFKLTTAQDIARAAALITGPAMDIRFGTGFDVHAFAEGDHVTLCGVDIPHDRTLSGHSDADVAMHALTDAIFGAIAEGDIGRWFPPSDMQWKGAASHIFLEKAAERVAARGGRIQNVDVTIICERPKIGPHADAMRAELARILGIEVGRVSVKATTSEKLGFTGRQEGIAAQAAACIILEGDAA
ncbi:bifunctional 2-C-methyl-D-erythritol 4-phosphate cytidylyltransferase/2-C-methyl-D-erythritol 2,4-cyclodiphosphate synthase [Rhodovulum sp. DZ06]|uniref:bifunctional 2-C-methyl-D-erythritol 4-phosphate cytidylyltransferase/2-C-methyl-D-erythritol 2,4-cyclodiphosphate synthase n=1 Tax=Rhodovulum sp. DZ06 TaxID=3425126 RepID=UPI003D344E49